MVFYAETKFHLSGIKLGGRDIWLVQVSGRNVRSQKYFDAFWIAGCEGGVSIELGSELI